jgi:hypothetical protein
MSLEQIAKLEINEELNWKNKSKLKVKLVKTA